MENGTTFKSSLRPQLLLRAQQISEDHGLFGRGPAVAQMLEAFDRVCRGAGEVLLVPGASGVGKTSLVRALRKPVQSTNGVFLHGKFNQYDSNVPYTAFRSALAEYCRLVDMDEEWRQDGIRDQILAGVGEHGHLLIDLVPEFEALLGRQPTVAPVSPRDAKLRFTGAVRSLLSAVCNAEHPTVLFLDDCQWADAASLELLAQLCGGDPLRYLLVVVSYRSDEVDSGHPLSATITDMSRQRIALSSIHLDNLNQDDVYELVSHSLPANTASLDNVVAQIVSRTNGNPFFAKTLLEWISQPPGVDTPRGNVASQQSLKALDDDLPLDIVDVFSQRLEAIDPACRDLLSIGACLGYIFDVETLSRVSGRSSDECHSLLVTNASGLVAPIWADSRTGGEESTAGASTFRFVHDRVQQAAYARIPVRQLAALRHRIACALLQDAGIDRLPERAADIVGHLNASVELVVDLDDRLRAVELNIMAATKARDATAFLAALQYHRAARRFLEAPDVARELWARRRHLTITLLHDQSEAEFLAGNYNEAEACVRLVIANSDSPVEKAEALCVLIGQHAVRAKYAEAIAAGREALAALEVLLPESDLETARDAEIAGVRNRLDQRSLRDSSTLPIAADPVICAAVKVLIAMGPPCYRSHQRLWSVIVPRVVNLILEYGQMPQIGYCYPAFAGLLAWVDNDYSTGREMLRVAGQLMSDPQASASDKAVYHLMVGSSARHWGDHIKRSSDDYAAAYEIGYRSGNLQYAAYAFGHNTYCRFYQGVSLDSLIRETRASLEFCRERRNQWAVDLLDGGMNVFRTLSAVDSPVDGGVWTTEYLTRVAANGNAQVACIYDVMRCTQCVIMGDWTQAMRIADDLSGVIHMVGAQGLLPWPEYVFARAIAMAAAIDDLPFENRSQLQAELRSATDQLRTWAQQCPDNFKHKFLLASAEANRSDGHAAAALDSYDRAIDAARLTGFVQWEGFANERAALFLRSLGHGRLEHGYLQQAYLCYHRWGAAAKLQQLAHQFRRSVGDDLDSLLGDESTAAKVHTTQRIAAKQVAFVQSQAEATAAARDHGDAVRRLDEMASAADALRAHVADGKSVSARLQRRMDDLELQITRQTAELHESQDDLTRTTERLELATRAAGIGIWDFNVSTTDVAVDSRARALFGVSGHAGQVAYREWTECVHPDDRRAFHEAVTLALDTGDIFSAEFRTQDCTGHIRFLKADGRVVCSDTGRARRFAGVCCDITEQKASEARTRQAQAAVRDVTALHHSIVAGAREFAIFTLDPHGTITSWNLGAERLKGYSRDEAIGMHFSRFYTADELQESAPAELLDAAMRQGSIECEGWRVRKDGTRFWANVVISALHDESGGLRGFSKITRDLSERRLSEQKLRESHLELERVNKSLETSNRELEQFASIASHDLQEPLRKISSYSQLLREECADALSVDGRQYLEIINDGSERLKRLIADLLSFSRITTRGQPLAPTDASECALNAIDHLEVAVRESGAEVVLGELPIVMADRSQLVRLFQNIIGNAIKYRRDEPPRIDVTVRDVGAHFEFAIRDNGIGIEERFYSRIFQIFQRLHNRREFGGTGIGLAVCKRIVERFGGSIWLDSSLGVGTTFWFTLAKPAGEVHDNGFDHAQ